MIVSEKRTKAGQFLCCWIPQRNVTPITTKYYFRFYFEKASTNQQIFRWNAIYRAGLKRIFTYYQFCCFDAESLWVRGLLLFDDQKCLFKIWEFAVKLWHKLVLVAFYHLCIPPIIKKCLIWWSKILMFIFFL